MKDQLIIFYLSHQAEITGFIVVVIFAFTCYAFVTAGSVGKHDRKGPNLTQGLVNVVTHGIVAGLGILTVIVIILGTLFPKEVMAILDKF